jgi:methanethiol S-methyltransferase
MWAVVAAITVPWRNVILYRNNWTWIPAFVLFCLGVILYKLAGSEFSLAQLGGLPEVLRNHGQQRLATAGIRARVRHPVYLGHLCEMLAWSVGTGLAACWALTALAIVSGAVMIRMEDRELEKRFGENYREYRSTVPAVLPKIRMMTKRADRSKLNTV